MKIPIVAVVGPTASGKTALGVELASEFGGEVVSADSMQLYKEIHIASAAPNASEMRSVPHHLIEFLSPGESFTVADYLSAATKAISDIHARGGLPLLVGGTGLYIDSLLSDTRFAPEPENHAVRQRLQEEARIFGNEEMHRRLSEIDTAAAERLHTNDLRRILRALEVYELTGKTMTECIEESRKSESPYDPLIIGITYKSRELLYKRIELRVEKMLEAGLESEARASYEKSFAGAGQAIGHKELYPYFEGKMTREEAVENLKKATRHYAKRQLTWFRKNENIHWIYADEAADTADEAVKLVKEWKNNCERKYGC